MTTEKTPVTILQELMAKIGTTPEYKVCSSVAENCQSIFKYSVTCDTVTTYGAGHSKKDAKHNAANAMLVKLKNSQIEALPVIFQNNTKAKIMPLTKPPDLNNSSENILHDNSVQNLQILCVKYKFGNPDYTVLQPSGPCHALTFNIECKVSNFKVSGSGRSKKIAKNDAARKMIDQMNNTFHIDHSNKKNGIRKAQVVRKEEDVIEPAKLKINYDFNLEHERAEPTQNSNLTNFLSELQNLSDMIRRCQKNICQENIIEIKQEFQSILDSLKIDFHHMLLQTTDPTTFMLIIQLNTDPDILEMSLGRTREEAEIRTINKVIESLKKFDR